MADVLSPLILENDFVRLEPLEKSHAEVIFQAGDSEEIWQYLPDDLITMENVLSWIEGQLQQQVSGTRLAYAVFDKQSGLAVGSSSLLNFDSGNRSIEIGWTWLTRAIWGSRINPAKKLLMMTHCFEQLGCVRVQFKTDRNNARSRKALEKIGAQFEGVLRSHMRRRNGTWRDSAFYSVIADEWPAVRNALEQRLLVSKDAGR